MKLHTVAVSTLAALFALTGAASALDVDVYIDVYSSNHAEAWVSVPAGTAVQAVELASDDPGCEFGPAEEVEPGVWHAVGGAYSSWDCWLVTARVMLPGAGGGEASWDQPCGPFVGLEKVYLKGESLTDSYDWMSGPYDEGGAGEEGHVCSNGKVKLGDDALVRGDVWHGYHMKAKDGAQVTGEVGMLPEPMALDAVDPGDAALVNDNLTIPFTDHGNLPLDGGKLSLKHGESVALDPGTYFFEKVDVADGASLHITGPTTIYVTGELHVKDGSIVNESQNPSHLKIFALGGSVKLHGETELHALIHGPDAKVHMKYGVDFYGTIAARYLKVKDSSLHADGGTEPAGEPEVIEVIWFSGAG